MKIEGLEGKPKFLIHRPRARNNRQEALDNSSLVPFAYARTATSISPSLALAIGQRYLGLISLGKSKWVINGQAFFLVAGRPAMMRTGRLGIDTGSSLEWVLDCVSSGAVANRGRGFDRGVVSWSPMPRSCLDRNWAERPAMGKRRRHGPTLIA